MRYSINIIVLFLKGCLAQMAKSESDFSTNVFFCLGTQHALCQWTCSEFAKCTKQHVFQQMTAPVSTRNLIAARCKRKKLFLFKFKINAFVKKIVCILKTFRYYCIIIIFKGFVILLWVFHFAFCHFDFC